MGMKHNAQLMQAIIALTDSAIHPADNGSVLGWEKIAVKRLATIRKIVEEAIREHEDAEFAEHERHFL